MNNVASYLNFPYAYHPQIETWDDGINRLSRVTIIFNFEDGDEYTDSFITTKIYVNHATREITFYISLKGYCNGMVETKVQYNGNDITTAVYSTKRAMRKIYKSYFRDTMRRRDNML